MKTTIYLVLLAIALSTNIDIFDNATNSHNLSNPSIFNYRLGSTNLGSIPSNDVSPSISQKEMKHARLQFSLLIITTIFDLLISKGRLKDKWKYHLIGIAFYTLMVQTQSQCYSDPDCSACDSNGCTSCISSSYYVGGTPPKCNLCSTSISWCKQCSSQTSCTACTSGYHTV